MTNFPAPAMSPEQLRELAELTDLLGKWRVKDGAIDCDYGRLVFFRTGPSKVVVRVDAPVKTKPTKEPS